MEGYALPLSIVVFVLIFFGSLYAAAIKVVGEPERAVIFRLGRFMGVRGPGLFFVIPTIDRVVKVDLRVTTLDVPPHRCTTRDRARVDVSTVVYYQVIEPERAILDVDDFRQATLEIAQSGLSNVIGRFELDELLAQRDRVNQQLQSTVNEQTLSWGVQVNRVEIKDVEPI